MSEEMSIISYAEDIADAEAPAALPPGDYPATIEAAEIKTSNNTGNQYISVTFNINPDDYPADFDINNAPEGLKVNFMRLSPDDSIRARYNMKRFIEAIGATKGREINLMEWIGLTAKIELTVDEYEGIKRNQIKSVKPA